MRFNYPAILVSCKLFNDAFATHPYPLKGQSNAPTPPLGERGVSVGIGGLILNLTLIILFLNSSPGFGQNSYVYGTVTDSSSNPVEKVNIFIDSGTTGTVSDEYGKYRLQLKPDYETTIYFRHISYLLDSAIIKIKPRKIHLANRALHFLESTNGFT